MVFYFKARPDVGDFTIFMGLDKHENEELIKYGFPEDICDAPMLTCPVATKDKKKIQIWAQGTRAFSCHMAAAIHRLLFLSETSIMARSFHVDKMSSAHVYVRMKKGQTIDDISEGNKVNNVDVVYTPWYNLKKTASMDVGQIGFHNSKMVRTVRVEKRINEVVNRLNKTKVERTPDLKAEREAVNAAERAERKLQLRDKASLMFIHRK
ncbi:hypothetical protein C5167_018750 [Papaver somniferum]|uniref:NFACT RNA-binding domain-containing protein n=1 Tax=Papaver somniferum TaxID=3469 RepID=A0A4Y7IN61_PAPSO|nr:hypothetical protein C5167_018750 [Papaver somniferum]